MSLAVIGNCAVNALVDAQARIVCCCMPRLSSPAPLRAESTSPPSGAAAASAAFGLVVHVDHGDACGQSRGNAGFEPRATEGSTVDTVPPKGTPGGPAPQVITMLVTPKTHGSRPSALHRR
ncbi:MAG TPA: hypothetical protein VIW70_18015 [Rubrivivax sp.]